MAIASKAGLTIENALQFVQAQASAVTDQLTGLPNTRSLFLHLDQELARSKRTGVPLAVFVLDLDGFKQVNDRFGHLLGNRVLQRTGEVLRGACREYDYVARMGGDEFVMVFPGLTSEGLHARCSQLCESVSAMGRRISGEDLLSLSIGEAVFPRDGTDAEQLLAVADKRMYQVKQLHSERSRPLPEFDFFPTEIAAIQ
jgi:diguanylate cyclase (GGDEF)-like protein